jgi:hypothetical protein
MTIRLITPALWAGTLVPPAAGLPVIDAAAGPVTIRGPISIDHPVTGGTIQVYERTAAFAEGQRRQLMTVTQGGAGLGRVSDQHPGTPEQRYTGDVVFPLGVWQQGEIREFEATEQNVFGPALRRIALEILDIDFVHEGAAHSLHYRLTIRDEAERVLTCEESVYSPGRGLVAFDASGNWRGCAACPCAG